MVAGAGPFPNRCTAWNCSAELPRGSRKICGLLLTVGQNPQVPAQTAWLCATGHAEPMYSDEIVNKLFIVSAVLSIATPAFTETLTQGERERAMSELHATRKQFLDSVAGL